MCNFKPNRSLSTGTLDKKIFCKNFIIFLMFLKFFKSINTSIFIKKKTKKTFMVLKAPHKDKLSKHLLKFQRYELLVSLRLPQSQENYYLSFFRSKKLLSNILYTFRRIDSSIATLKTVKASIGFNFSSVLK